MPRGAQPKPTEEVTLKVSHEKGFVVVERGFTKNMDNFNSARVSVTIKVPINPTKEELEDATKTVEIVNEKIIAILETELDKLEV